VSDCQILKKSCAPWTYLVTAFHIGHIKTKFIKRGDQYSKWKFRSAGIILKSKTRIYRQKMENINGYNILISAGIKLRNKEKFQHGMAWYVSQRFENQM
jgi:hypothetical protein